ncbi:MAG: DUF1566 domain-containing protein [Campylobacterota bacterium]|nr:DUF1566 domain-containing protein [Campylobacterota bacterium]
MKGFITITILFVTLIWASFIPKFGGGSEKGRVDPNFTRDNNQSIVTDTKNKKSYTDIKSTTRYTNAKAISYCEKLTHATFSDWRLPSKNELKSLLDYTRKPVQIKYPFNNIQEGRYWSATQANQQKSYYVDFDIGRFNRTKSDKEYYALCVRGN